MRIRGNLKGDLTGLWSVTVRANWRMILRFEDSDALDVDGAYSIVHAAGAGSSPVEYDANNQGQPKLP